VHRSEVDLQRDVRAAAFAEKVGSRGRSDSLQRLAVPLYEYAPRLLASVTILPNSPGWAKKAGGPMRKYSLPIFNSGGMPHLGFDLLGDLARH
jgi:hypothetical protein